MSTGLMKSETIGKLALALAKAQSKMRAAAKDSTNPHFKSKYADLASIWDACRESLAENELSITQIPTGDAEAGIVGMITLLLHSSGEWIGGEATARPADLKPQSVGSAITYLRRYGLAAVVGVISDDDDGQAGSNQQASRQEVARPQQVASTPKSEPVKSPSPAAVRANEMVKKLIKSGLTADVLLKDVNTLTNKWLPGLLAEHFATLSAEELAKVAASFERKAEEKQRNAA